MNIPEYVWIYNNRQDSEYVSYITWYLARSLYKLLSTYLLSPLVRYLVI